MINENPSQTAYVPGRSIMDNLRANNFIKQHCEKNGIEAALTSLDARKAFDSVNHKYIDNVLMKYGFGDTFRKYFKIIYKDLTAKVLVNGYFSEKINIERGVKQGDALSCAIFILCIDPLLRNLNKNEQIKPIQISQNNKKLGKYHKACGFADDISVISMNDAKSIKSIFSEYQRLTDKSGLTLNADKTEIIKLNPASQINHFVVTYENTQISIKCITALKICGIYFCNDPEEEYTKNVREKIQKLKRNLKIWQSRHLTMEGKSLIIKTFGVSQIIYNMQCVEFAKSEITKIEQYIFNFLWDTKNIEETRARDRIKRSVMKNDYNEGGLKITDVECLDRALKLRQYIRANNSKHVIKVIQEYCSDNNKVIAQEFNKIAVDECVCKSAQETINIIVDHTRNENFGEKVVDDLTSQIAIKQIAMININTYLNRKGRVFLSCILKPFGKEGLENLFEITRELESELDRNRSKRLESIINAFPKYYRNVANSFDDDAQMNNKNNLTHFLKVDQTWTPIEIITTKELQLILKNALKKITKVDFQQKLNIENDVIDIIQLRNDCKNAKLRNIYFRLIHNDFFTYERMFKYKMTDTEKCPRCDSTENTKHLLWECPESRKIWEVYNEMLSSVNLPNLKINQYADIYRTEVLPVLSTIKLKLIQETIQIIRPVKWNKERLQQTISDLRNKELYNGECKNDIIKTKKRWEKLLKL
jgi:hypothetical protein